VINFENPLKRFPEGILKSFKNVPRIFLKCNWGIFLGMFQLVKPPAGKTLTVFEFPRP